MKAYLVFAQGVAFLPEVGPVYHFMNAVKSVI